MRYLWYILHDYFVGLLDWIDEVAPKRRRRRLFLTIFAASLLVGGIAAFGGVASPHAPKGRHRVHVGFSSAQVRLTNHLVDTPEPEVSGGTYTLTTGNTKVPCARGTRDLGIHTGYMGGSAIAIRLCALNGLRSYSQESKVGDPYYVVGSNGDAIVNSVASSHFASLVRSAQAAGIPLAATSSFRTMAHQQSIWNGNPNPAWVAPPGHSNHQQGAAIDFAFPTAQSVSTNCRWEGSWCTLRGDRVWNWLNANASKSGLHQYVGEFWHFSPTGN